MANWIINMAIIAGTFFFIVKFVLPSINKKRAAKALDEILFPNGEPQKNKVIESFKKITKQQFTNEEIIDYFIKEKGMQLMSITPDFSESLKKYLQLPTLVELNYFEMVKFNETFINYPRNFEPKKIENADTLFELKPDNKKSAFLCKEGYAS